MDVDRKRGVALDAAIPLAQQLSELIKQSASKTPAPTVVSTGEEVLYRMVIPAKVLRLSSVELTRRQGLRAPIFTSREVDRLMRAAHQIHELGDGVTADDRPTDVAIEIARGIDGSLVVFPAVPA